MISTLAWIKSGVAAEQPKLQKLTDQEYAEIMAKIEANLPPQNRKDDQNVDEECSDSDHLELPLEQISNLVEEDDADQGEEIQKLAELEEAEELEEARILPDDRMLVAGRTEDDVSYLDVYIFEESETNLYVHHDIMLPSVPLCVQPIYRDKNEMLNLVAVGTFDADVEVWDLDILDPVYPKYLLRRPAPIVDESKKPKKKTKKEGKRKEDEEGQHAVMCMSWNLVNTGENNQLLLLSGGADGSVRLWDVCKESCLLTLPLHRDKVQCVVWTNLVSEPRSFASASYDRTVQIVALSASLTGNDYQSFVIDQQLTADPECLAWDPWHPGRLMIGLENGHIVLYDVCKEGSDKKYATFTGLFPESSPCTAVSFSPFIPDLILIVGGMEWKILRLSQTGNYKVLIERTLDCKLFTGAWSMDTPWLLAVGGHDPQITVVNLASDVNTVRVINDLLEQNSMTTSN